MLCVTMQLSEETDDYNFLNSVLLNIFHNIRIYNFLMKKENNTNFNFLKETISNLVKNYLNYDYKLKLSILEAFEYLFYPYDYEEVSISKNNSELIKNHKLFLDQFFKDFYSISNGSESEDVDVCIVYFIEYLYRDFQTHDFEEYEIVFLTCLQSMFKNDDLMYSMLCNFELVLYLLNKRPKVKAICEKKFEIVKQISINKLFNEKAQEEVIRQFKDYVKSGIY